MMNAINPNFPRVARALLRAGAVFVLSFTLIFGTFNSARVANAAGASRVATVGQSINAHNDIASDVESESDADIFLIGLIAVTALMLGSIAALALTRRGMRRPQ